MWRILVAVSAIAFVGLLGGCAHCSGDPSQVGMGCELSNQLTGRYREDNAALQREIAATRARAAELRAERDRNLQRASELSGRRRTLARRLSALNAETAELSDRIATLESQGQASGELRRLRERTQSLADAQLALAEKSEIQEARLQRLEAEQAAIHQDINRLLGAS